MRELIKSSARFVKELLARAWAEVQNDTGLLAVLSIMAAMLGVAAGSGAVAGFGLGVTFTSIVVLLGERKRGRQKPLS